MRWLALLFLSACASTTYEQLQQEASDCGRGPECRELWERAERKYTAMERRKARDFNPCAKGEVFVTDTRGMNACLSRKDLRKLF